jgi:hypothetical protein
LSASVLVGCVVGFDLDLVLVLVRPKPTFVAYASWPSAWKISGLLPFIDGLMRRKGTEILREEGEERRENEKK